MPFSLAEWAISEVDPLRKGVMLGLAQEGLIADILNWRDINDLSETGVRYDSVISPDYVPLNGSIAEKTTSGKNLSYGVAEMAVHIDIPVALEKARNNLERPSVRQTMLALRGSAYVVNDTFINGDLGSDPNSFDGLNKIVGNMQAAQTIGASEIDVRMSQSPTDATQQLLLDRIHQGFHYVEGHLPDATLANRNFLLAFESVLRREKVPGYDFNWRDAALEVDDPRIEQRTKSTRPAFMYRQVPWYDIGFKADQSTLIIGNTYQEGGAGGAQDTRIFNVKFREEDVEGIQFSPLEMLDIGMLENKNVYRKRLVWRHGIAVWGPRSITKVQGIRVD